MADVTCPDIHTGRTCTQPDGHPPPHRDRLGTWVHVCEYPPTDQGPSRSKARGEGA